MTQPPLAPPTVESCMAAAADRLKAAGIDQPRREGRLLLAYALGLDPATVIGHPEYPVSDRDGFLALVEQRARGVPMAHILGRREFWSLDFRVTPDTLDPRPDSETLVEAALAALAGRRGDALSVLDLGTGTGCLLLAVLSELPCADGTGVDLSQAAAAIARENARRLGLDARCRFVVGDWAAAIHSRFDLILSNPPYIPKGEIVALQREVARFEPRLALDGGPDGLDAYRRIGAELPRLLQPDGIAILEVGAGQWGPVAGMMRDAGLRVGAPRADLAGVERCVICYCSEGVN
jgi:release factor glutamine methyltransferase